MCKNSTIDYKAQRQRINEIVKKFKKEVGLDPILDWDNDSFLTHLETLYTQTNIQSEIAKRAIDLEKLYQGRELSDEEVLNALEQRISSMIAYDRSQNNFTYLDLHVSDPADEQFVF